MANFYELVFIKDGKSGLIESGDSFIQMREAWLNADVDLFISLNADEIRLYEDDFKWAYSKFIDRTTERN